MTQTPLDVVPSTISFDVPAQSFAVDEAARTIFGLVIPWGAVSSLKLGRRYRFSAAAMDISPDVSRIKLLVQHERAAAVGYTLSFSDDPAGKHFPGSLAGLWGRWKVARGPEGDRALQMAADHVWDGLSVGITSNSTFNFSSNPADAIRATVEEVSLVPNPSFPDSRVAGVVHSTDDGRITPVPPETAPPPAPAPPAPAPPATPPPTPAEAGVQFNTDAITAAIAQGFSTLVLPPRVAVSPGSGLRLQVTEETPYRFDGTVGQAAFDFSTDVIAWSRGDAEAGERVNNFIALAFATTITTDVDELNPLRQIPGMYVENLAFQYPIWEAINKGSLADGRGFSFPKFNTSSGLVGNHTENVEPTVGSFTTTGQTVQPTPSSGKVEISREVWDMGGTPQLSALIWQEIVLAWYEALEVAAVAHLDSLTPVGITITTAAADAALEGEISAALAMLAYIRGGNRMRDFFVQVDLFKKLVAAKDTTGRKLFPVLSPSNATGTTDPFFGTVMVGGLAARPAWALAASGIVAASSYLFARSDVWGWATPPQRIDMPAIAVKTVSIGVWGYKAFATTRLAGVREVIYDPI